MTKELVKSDPIKTILANNFQAIKSVLPKHLTPDRAVRIAYTTIAKSPKLKDCSQLSIINAVIEASMLGLEIGGPLSHAHLIPFNRSANLVIGYQGYMDLAYRSDRISNFQAHPVYEKDVFEYNYGTEARVYHKPCEDDDSGKLIAAYAIAFYKGGGFDFEIVNNRIANVAKNRSAAKSKKDSPWNQKDIEWTMWVKTAIRQLVKRVPLSPAIQRANAIETLVESGKPQLIDHIKPDDIQEIDLSDKINKELMSKIKKGTDIGPKEITPEIIDEVLQGENGDVMTAAMENLGYSNVPASQKDLDNLWAEYKSGLPVE